MRSPQNMSVSGIFTVKPASAARLNAASTLSRYRYSRVGCAVDPISGKASLTKIAELPMRSLACQIFLPLGSGARSTSSAPNARL